MVVTLAGTLGLKGYIEILPDGKAFIIAEGPKADLARFVSAIRIDNAKIRGEGILIDCREATGEFGDFHEILPRQEMQLHLCKESKKTMIDSFFLMNTPQLAARVRHRSFTAGARGNGKVRP